MWNLMKNILFGIKSNYNFINVRALCCVYIILYSVEKSRYTFTCYISKALDRQCSPITKYFLKVHHISNTLKVHTHVRKMSHIHYKYLTFGEHRMLKYKCLVVNARVEKFKKIWRNNNMRRKIKWGTYLFN